MSDFLAVLGAGIAIIIVALLISGSSLLGTEEERINVTLFSEASVGQVGAVEETFRHVPLGTFTVGQTLGEETAKEVPALKIESGWFGEHSESLKFSGAGALSAYVTFRVEDTNSYGSLRLVFNSRVIYDNITAPGNYRVEILNPAADNTLEIRAQSSGAKFWAPTTYAIKDLKVVVRKYMGQERVIPFTVYDYEATGWERGRIAFGIDDAVLDADLIISINGNEIYRDRPISRALIHQKDFTREGAGIKPGENTIRFRTEEKGKYSLSNADLIMFFYAGGQTVSKSLYFDADSDDVDALNNRNATGVIIFNVKDIFLDSGITFSLNNKKIELPEVNVGENSVNFTKGYLKDGENALKISTRGSYRIGELDVSLLKKGE